MFIDKGAICSAVSGVLIAVCILKTSSQAIRILVASRSGRAAASFLYALFLLAR